jgi:hypothetical protein
VGGRDDGILTPEFTVGATVTPFTVNPFRMNPFTVNLYPDTEME